MYISVYTYLCLDLGKQIEKASDCKLLKFQCTPIFVRLYMNKLGYSVEYPSLS